MGSKLLSASKLSASIIKFSSSFFPFTDIFVSIHADGNSDPSISGYKVAAPRRDHTEKAEEFATLLGIEYQNATKLRLDTNITRTMRGYYAFNWRRYDHSLHPLTVATIIETGFLTNANDRRVIVGSPDKPANGIASGILKSLDVTTEMTQESDTKNPTL